MTTAPLAGIRVLDFSRVLSGPHCGRMLADLGADVIKVEPPEGDLTRYAHPRANSIALYFAQQNCGKRNISLDLERPEAVDVLLRLAETADVVLENFRPGVMDRMGVGYATVHARNPRLVYASISGYGQTGPDRDRRAYATVIHAEMGLVASAEQYRPSGDPTQDAMSHADTYSGLACLAAILAALYQREHTGTGQHLDIAMAEAMLCANDFAHVDLSGADMTDKVPSLAPPYSPTLRTADGREVVIAGDPAADGMFEAYSAVMDRADLAADPRFATRADRRRHRDALLGLVQDWVLTFPTTAALEARLGTHRIAMGVVRTVAEAGRSPWAQARGAVVDVDDRGGATVPIPNSPWRFSAAATGVRGVAAYRGEHNREVLREVAGLTDAEIDHLEAAGVLSSRLPQSPNHPARKEQPC